MAHSDQGDPNDERPSGDVGRVRVDHADLFDRIWTKLRYSKLARVAAGYAATALAIASGQQLVAEALGWPQSPQRIVIALLVAGLPLVLIIVWLRRRHAPLRRTRDQAVVVVTCVISAALFLLIAPNWRAHSLLASTDAPPPGPPADLVTFRDCDHCPEVVVVPAGSFVMGSNSSEDGHAEDEGPLHSVNIAAPFAVGRFEVTWIEWNACVRLGGCSEAGVASAGGDEGWGRGNRPLVNASWDDAQEYVRWLSEATGKPYRLLSEAEWEYAARAGTRGPFFFGRRITPIQANYD